MTKIKISPRFDQDISSQHVATECSPTYWSVHATQYHLKSRKEFILDLEYR
jgi:hypothetical protein